MGHRVSDRYPFKPLFSASALDAIIRCPGAATLPVIEISTDEDKAAAAIAMDAGTVEHAEVLSRESLPANLQHWLTKGWSEELKHGLTPECNKAGIWFERRFLACFWDLRDNLIASPVDVWDGDFTPYITAGTPDAFSYWFDSDGLHIRVGDLKTGAGQSAGRLPHPSQSWQLRYYALAVLLWLGWRPLESVKASDVVGRVNLGADVQKLASCKVSFWTRDYLAEREAEPELDPVDRMHVWRIKEADLDEQLLSESIVKLQELTRQLTQAPSNNWRVGHWCGGCRSLMACPVHKDAIDRLGIATEGQLTDDKISDAYDAIDVVEAQLAAAKRSVESYVTQRGDIPMRGSRTLIRTLRKAPRRVTAAALPALKEKFPAQYVAMVRESVSVTSIAAAMGEAAPGPRTAMVLAELETVKGAVVSGENYELRVRKNGSD